MSSTSIIFPGQGSQSQGMLADIAEVFSEVKETFEEASTELSYDMWDIVQNNPDDKLNQTQYTQPTLLVASMAIYRIFKKNCSITPKYLAGHSLGEYTALVSAGVLAFVDAVKLVERRGQFMQEAVPAGQGAMAAVIGLDDDLVRELCEQAAQGEILAPANYNSLGQIVVAGNVQAVHRLVELAKENKAKIAMLIPVSVPSHCELMKPASEKLAQVFVDVDVKTPSIPVIQNYDVLPHNEPEAIINALLCQLDHPVRWVETVQFMLKEGVDTMIECGPGKVLTGLIKRINRDVNTHNIGTLTGLTKFLEGA